MIEEVDDGGRGVERAAHRIVVGDIGEPARFCICAKLLVKRLPIAAVAAQIDVFIERNETGVLFLDIIEDDGLERAAQVQIFQPDEIAVVFRAFDDGGNVGDAGENRGDKAGRPHPRIVERFHRGKAARDRGGSVHVVFEVFVERVDRPGDARPREALDKVEIAQDKVGLRCNGKLHTAPSELFEDGAGAPVSCLGGLIGVCHRAQEHLFPLIPFGMGEGFPIFDVHKASPRLLMVRKPLHKTRIAVFACVFAADIGVERIVAHRKIALRKRVFGLCFAYYHSLS